MEEAGKTIVLTLPNAAATCKLGIWLGQTLPAGTTLLLAGNLGSGKTTLVQGIGQGLGIQDAVDSPTFTLINEYTEGRVPLYHLDLYRLDPAETADLYPETYWEGAEIEPGITAIEWAERLPYRPSSYLEIQLSYSENSGRQVTLTSVGQHGTLPELSDRLWELTTGS